MVASKKCPVCNKEMVVAYRPFCSARCKDVDLGRWFQERYVIAEEDAENGSL